MGKLSRPQQILLQELADNNISTVESYKPGQALVAKGLAVLHTGTFGSCWLSITDAGRSILKDAQ